MLTPIRFGEPSRQLFGLYQGPSGQDRAHGVLLCNPFGQEAIRSHRLMRVLADRLARSGFHVLRFDYFATGDSDGEDAAGDLDRWIDDVARADGELARASGCRNRSWFGLRLGATLAALASGMAARQPARLVLWDPVVDGREYLVELARAHVAALGADTDPAAAEWASRDPRSDGAFDEALGFPLPPALRAQIGRLTPEVLAGCRARHTTLLASDAFDGMAALGDLLRRNGAAADARVIDAEIVWASDEAMNSAIVPAAALQAVTAALGGEA